jgi:hypothetical protein
MAMPTPYTHTHIGVQRAANDGYGHKVAMVLSEGTCRPQTEPPRLPGHSRGSQSHILNSKIEVKISDQMYPLKLVLVPVLNLVMWYME